MSYEPNVHKVQMTILRSLLFSTHASFGELRRQTGMDSDLFNFHLKKLVENCLVSKHSPGQYSLSARGKTYANTMDTADQTIEKQPKLSVVVIVEAADGKQLFQERLKQPYYGYWSHPTGKIRWGETILETAARELAEETGLSANLRVAGIYHNLDHDKQSGELLEDKFFCIVHGTDPQGRLVDGEGCHNEWLTTEEFLQKSKRFGDPADTRQTIESQYPTIRENRFFYDPEHY